MTFFWNILITAMYWGFVLPNGGENQVQYTTNTNIIMVIDHTLPFIYTTIDWCLNSIGA